MFQAISSIKNIGQAYKDTLRVLYLCMIQLIKSKLTKWIFGYRDSQR